MKAYKAIVIGIAATLFIVPTAYADSNDTLTTTTEVPSTVVTPPTTSTVVPPPTTNTTTTTELPVTTELPTTNTTTTTELGTETTDVDDVSLAAPCDDATCAPVVAGAGATPTAVGGGGQLPYTGISDVIAPIMLAIVVLLAGVVIIRWAQVREAVARNASRRIISGSVIQEKTGYSSALKDAAIKVRARRVFEPRVA